MRQVADARHIRRLMSALGAKAEQDTRVYFDEIEPLLYRYPAIDPPSFRQALDEMLGEAAG